MMFKFGYVAVLGKPNAGKSTLINRLVGETVAIVSSKPQTTRENIVGVVNGKDFQIAFLDTPGIHKTSTYLDKFMMKNVRSAKSGADVILYLTDSSKEADEDEIKSIEKMKKDGLNVVIAKSKCDKRKKNGFLANIEFSAVTGENLDKLVKLLVERLPEAEKPMFADDEFTDKPIKFFIAEFLREATLKILEQEIPHGIAVEIVSFKDGHVVNIEADIVCSKASHKGIIIGNKGLTLKKIGTMARKSMEEFLGKKVNLKLFVKVEENWQNNPNKLTALGYN